jgi:hypothetical protein
LVLKGLESFGGNIMTSHTLAFDVTWTEPARRTELLSAILPKTSCIYAITVRDEKSRRMLRLGATSNIRQRIKGYKILDFIPNAEVSFWAVSDEFRKLVEPYAIDYFSDPKMLRPKHLRDKTIEYCLSRELGKAEYKAELVIIKEYMRRHDNRLPPGNARSGSKRAYIPDVQVIENGDWKLLDLPLAKLPARVTISGDDLIRLLW